MNPTDGHKIYYKLDFLLKKCCNPELKLSMPRLIFNEKLVGGGESRGFSPSTININYF